LKEMGEEKRRAWRIIGTRISWLGFKQKWINAFEYVEVKDNSDQPSDV